MYIRYEYIIGNKILCKYDFLLIFIYLYKINSKNIFHSKNKKDISLYAKNSL